MKSALEKNLSLLDRVIGCLAYLRPVGMHPAPGDRWQLPRPHVAEFIVAWLPLPPRTRQLTCILGLWVPPAGAAPKNLERHHHEISETLGEREKGSDQIYHSQAKSFPPPGLARWVRRALRIDELSSSKIESLVQPSKWTNQSAQSRPPLPAFVRIYQSSMASWLVRNNPSVVPIQATRS